MNLTQNDPRVAVALPCELSYGSANDQLYPNLQNFDADRADRCPRDEPETVGQCGWACKFGQAFTSCSLRRFGRLGAARVAKDLGRDALFVSRGLRHRHRDITTCHGVWANRLFRGHTRQLSGRGARSDVFPFFLDTTPTLKRRFSCAA